MHILYSLLIYLKHSKASFIDRVGSSEVLNSINSLHNVLIIASHSLHNRDNIVLITAVVGSLKREGIVLEIGVSSLVCMVMGANIK